MDDFIALLPSVRVQFPSDPIDPFFNINTPDDLSHAEALLPPIPTPPRVGGGV
jgi:molybdopterin-guanine dinucleotide biosynthesis protein A